MEGFGNDVVHVFWFKGTDVESVHDPIDAGAMPRTWEAGGGERLCCLAECLPDPPGNCWVSGEGGTRPQPSFPAPFIYRLE